jgi:5-hydroxyisourate hydrolase-like protein (transthyretin family)
LVHLLLRGPGASRDAQTDEHGRYDIAGVPAGIYELQAIPPAVFSARNLQHRVNIPDSRACVAADFRVQYDGRISGVALTSDGQPAAAVQVELISGDALWISERLTTKSDRDGRFEFEELSPGRYGIGVSLRRTIEPPILYPKTLYPGTPTETYAAIIELGEGDHLQLEPLRLPPALESHELAGVVLWPDGRLASGVTVWLDDGERSDRIVASSLRTGSDGRFKFIVHAGLSYRVRALYTFSQGGDTQRFEAADEPFVASAQLRSPRLVLAPIVGQ